MEIHAEYFAPEFVFIRTWALLIMTVKLTAMWETGKPPPSPPIPRGGVEATAPREEAAISGRDVLTSFAIERPTGSKRVLTL